MNVLITGAGGFIGSHLSDRFIKEGYRVIGVDNFLTGNPANVEHLKGNPNFKLVVHDIVNPLLLEEKVDVVLHFACPASPVDYILYPIETLKVDSIGTFNALDIALKNKAKFVFASTSEIYGDPLVHPQPETYWGNVNTLGPRAVYDEAKRFSEALTMAYHNKYGVDTRMVRIFNTYGPRMRLNDGRVVPNFITQALQGKDLTVYGDGSQTRSFCYVDDLVDGIFRIATREGLLGEVMNLGNPAEHTIAEFAKIIVSMVGSSSGIISKDLPMDDPKQRKPVIEKAMRLLEWMPKVKLEDGLEHTISYFNRRLKKEAFSQ